MPKLAFEDFTPGTVTDYGPLFVSRDEIISFAREFDPQPFHLDDGAARASMLGGLAGSGWHMCAVMMRLLADGLLINSTSMGSPGVDEVKWLRPFRPDTNVTLRVAVIETRQSKSRTDMGFVKLRCDLLDGAGEILARFTTPMMFGRRETRAS